MATQALTVPELVAEQSMTPVVIARNPQEMAIAQANTAEWFTRKVGSVDLEIAELQLAVDEARKHKWKISTLASQLSKARGRKRFYEKVLAAVQAGYAIVPSFPIDVFAIRVSRTHVKESPSSYRENWAMTLPRDERPDVLDVGEGRYQSPTQLVTTQKKKDGETTWITLTPADFGDIEFPVSAAFPQVMDSTDLAMTQKIFDRIGICPQTKRNKDPMIIGQILESSPKWGEPKAVNFLIAWWLDLRTI